MASLKKRSASAAVLAPVSFIIILYGGLPFTLFVLICAGLALHEWFDLAGKTKHKLLFFAAGIIYIALAFWCCYWLRVGHSASIALLFISMVWVSDTGGYFFGKMIGGPKMAVEISPNKTWAGLAGASINPALLAVIFFLLFSGFNLTALVVAFISGAIVGLVGQGGDLVISSLKRLAGTKDSGQLIPGHGGLLDRIDAMMLAAPVFLFIVSKFPYVFS